MIDFIAIFQQFGFVGVAFAVLAWMLLIFVKRLEKLTESNDRRLDQMILAHNEERKSWACVINENTQTLMKIFNVQN